MCTSDSVNADWMILMGYVWKMATHVMNLCCWLSLINMSLLLTSWWCCYVSSWKSLMFLVYFYWYYIVSPIHWDVLNYGCIELMVGSYWTFRDGIWCREGLALLRVNDKFPWYIKCDGWLMMMYFLLISKDVLLSVSMDEFFLNNVYGLEFDSVKVFLLLLSKDFDLVDGKIVQFGI